jgi:hypothetical protein
MSLLEFEQTTYYHLLTVGYDNDRIYHDNEIGLIIFTR